MLVGRQASANSVEVFLCSSMLLSITVLCLLQLCQFCHHLPKLCLLQPQSTFILSQSTTALSVLSSPSQALSASTSKHLHPVTINNSSVSSVIAFTSSDCFNLKAPSSCHNQQQLCQFCHHLPKLWLLQPQSTFILSQSTTALSVLPSPSQALSASTSKHLHPVTINNSSVSSVITFPSSVCFNLKAPSSCHNQQQLCQFCHHLPKICLLQPQSTFILSQSTTALSVLSSPSQALSASTSKHLHPVTINNSSVSSAITFPSSDCFNLKAPSSCHNQQQLCQFCHHLPKLWLLQPQSTFILSQSTTALSVLPSPSQALSASTSKHLHPVIINNSSVSSAITFTSSVCFNLKAPSSCHNQQQLCQFCHHLHKLCLLQPQSTFILSQSTTALSVLPSPSQALSASTSKHLHPVTINNSSVSSAITFPRSVCFNLKAPSSCHNQQQLCQFCHHLPKLCLLQPQSTFILSQSTTALSVLPSPSQALSASTSKHLHPVTINNSSVSSAITFTSSVCFNLKAPSSCHNQQQLCQFCHHLPKICLLQPQSTFILSQSTTALSVLPSPSQALSASTSKHLHPVTINNSSVSSAITFPSSVCFNLKAPSSCHNQQQLCQFCHHLPKLCLLQPQSTFILSQSTTALSVLPSPSQALSASTSKHLHPVTINNSSVSSVITFILSQSTTALSVLSSPSQALTASTSKHLHPVTINNSSVSSAITFPSSDCFNLKAPSSCHNQQQLCQFCHHLPKLWLLQPQSTFILSQSTTALSVLPSPSQALTASTSKHLHPVTINNSSVSSVITFPSSVCFNLKAPSSCHNQQQLCQFCHHLHPVTINNSSVSSVITFILSQSTTALSVLSSPSQDLSASTSNHLHPVTINNSSVSSAITFPSSVCFNLKAPSSCHNQQQLCQFCHHLPKLWLLQPQSTFILSQSTTALSVLSSPSQALSASTSKHLHPVTINNSSVSSAITFPSSVCFNLKAPSSCHNQQQLC